MAAIQEYKTVTAIIVAEFREEITGGVLAQEQFDFVAKIAHRAMGLLDELRSQEAPADQQE